MLYNTENIRLQSLQILYTFFVLRLPQNGRTPVNFRHFVVSVIQKCTKFANFASVYFPYFKTFRHQLNLAILLILTSSF